MGAMASVLFVSPAAELADSACRRRELFGHGLFDRVHVADRPAYLTALADAASSSEERSRRIPHPPGRSAAHQAGHFVWVEMRCRPLDHVAGKQDPA